MCLFGSSSRFGVSLILKMYCFDHPVSRGGSQSSKLGNLICTGLHAQGAPSGVWGSRRSWHSCPLIWGHIGHGRLFRQRRDNGLRGRGQRGSCNWRILAPLNSETSKSTTKAASISRDMGIKHRENNIFVALTVEEIMKKIGLR